jgi:bifunctional N-acetylglucosamine-1-phosphate-uridyltransferase/glucosamine-1-phosphate-acetyltransferase GlmU-like protein
MAGSERQITDVAGILRTQGADIDVEYVERWVAVLGVQSEWERASAEAGLTKR